MKSNVFKYVRHGVEYKTKIPEGMTRSMMKHIYSADENIGTYQGAIPLTYPGVKTYRVLTPAEKQFEDGLAERRGGNEDNED